MFVRWRFATVEFIGKCCLFKWFDYDTVDNEHPDIFIQFEKFPYHNKSKQTINIRHISAVALNLKDIFSEMK